MTNTQLWPPAHLQASTRVSPGHRALRVALFYAVLAGAWILISDSLLGMWVDQELLTQLSMVKGLFFVGATASVLWWLTRRQLTLQEEASAAALEAQNAIGLVDLASDGRIVRCSSWFAALLGSTPPLLRGKALEDALESAGASVVEPVPIGSRGQLFELGDGTVLRIQGQVGQADGLHAVAVEEVTEAVRLGRALLLSKARYVEAQRLGRIGHWVFYEDGHEHQWSQEVYRIFGVDPETFRPTDKSVAARVHPDDAAIFDAFARDLAQERGEVSHILRLRTEAGDTRWVQVRAVAERDDDGTLTSRRGTLQDVTDQVEATERVRQLNHALARHSAALAEAVEQERKALSRDVHDQLGQPLSALRMMLGDPQATPAAAVSIVDDLMVEVRRIARRVRPPLLDQLGLADALRRLGRDQPQQPIGVDTSGVDELSAKLDTDRAVHAYRVVQEALSNAQRHSGGTLCRIALCDEGCRVVLSVDDDGKGLDEASRDGFGMISMRQRAGLASAVLHIGPSDLGGVRVLLTMPREIA